MTAMFNIYFRGNPFNRDGEDLLLGTIEGPDFKEDFWSPLGYWQKNQYESQWRSGVINTLNGKPSALIASIRDPKYANFINLWLLYPFGEDIALQNQMLALESLQEPFDEQKINSYIRPYLSHNEEGDTLSEWRIPTIFFDDFVKHS